MFMQLVFPEDEVYCSAGEPTHEVSCEQCWIPYEPPVSNKMIFFNFWKTIFQYSAISLFIFHSVHRPNQKLQPSSPHDAPPAFSQNTATLCEPKLLSTRQLTKHQATAAGSGEFSFFKSLDCYCPSCLKPEGNNIKRANKRPSLYGKKQCSCAWLSSRADLSDNRSVYSSSLYWTASHQWKDFLGIDAFEEMINCSFNCWSLAQLRVISQILFGKCKRSRHEAPTYRLLPAHR